MVRRVRIVDPGDTELLEDELLDSNDFRRLYNSLMAEGKVPPSVEPVLLGVTQASLSADSFLAAASFQETTRVLTEAALAGKIDRLPGLKETVIIGTLITARAKKKGRATCRGRGGQ